jgi:uncharacterized protein YndB with AHSA1/START domain
MLPLIALGAVAVVGGVLGYAASRPDAFRIQRSRTIKAPPERVYALIDDFHSWLQWSPWEKLDPALVREFEGPASGVGARYWWKGNKQVGEGRMEITDASPPNRLVIRLEFIAPWKAVNTTTFQIDPDGDGSRITWSMDGSSPFMMKVMGVFMSMDRMVGRDFEKGLESMAAAAER